MDIEELRSYCLDKPGVTESFPFDEHTLVFKAGGKMYALVGLERQPMFVNLKGEPEKNVELRENHPEAIQPGYHMNKVHWNSVYFQDLPEELVLELIDQSYALIIQSLPKKKREELK